MVNSHNVQNIDNGHTLFGSLTFNTFTTHRAASRIKLRVLIFWFIK